MHKSKRKERRGPDHNPAVDNAPESLDRPYDSQSSAGLARKKDLSAAMLAGAVSLATFLIYLASLWNNFVLWDDDWYVFENPHIRSFDLTFLKWAFFDFYSGNWHPLTWISHAMDCAIWGLNPLGHHLTNNILHAANTFLVVLLTMRLIKIYRERRSVAGKPLFPDDRTISIIGGVTGLLFGLHPLHVESVAWVSERKDLLCAMFFLLSIMMYVRYYMYATSLQSAKGKGQGAKSAFATAPGALLSALCFFILALLSKPMAITLPAVLFILDWYPLSRIQTFKSFWKVFIEKIPFIVLGLISSVLTVFAQKAGGALSTVVMTFEPLSSRAALAAKSLLSYLWMMILPLDLIPLYPYPMNISPLSLEYLLPVVFVIAITITCVIFAKKQKLWLAVWSYYVITLLPVLGLVPVGIQSMADRYTYLPSLGPFLIVGLLASWVARRVSDKKNGKPIIRVVSAAIAFLILVTMTYLTFEQIRIWKDSITMWGHVIEVEPAKVPLAYGNRGVSFAEIGDLNRALEDYNRAIALDPFYTGIYYERGLVLAKMHKFEKAISDYDKAITLDESGAKSDVAREDYFLHRGLAYLELARTEIAIADFKQACHLGSKSGCEVLEAFTSTGSKPEM